MTAKKGTNMERLTRHREELARCRSKREALDARIARLEATVQEEENQEYLFMVHSASISLEDMRQIMMGRLQEANAQKEEKQKMEEENEES